MIKEAILKSVLILFMRSREDPTPPIFPTPALNHLQLLHRQITGNVTLHCEALLMHVLSLFCFFKSALPAAALLLSSGHFSVVAISGRRYCSW